MSCLWLWVYDGEGGEKIVIVDFTDLCFSFYIGI